jgi:hypothetical protein
MTKATMPVQAGEAPARDTGHEPRLAGDLAVWLIILAELLAFAILFLAFAVSRLRHPDVFAASQPTLDTSAGLVNTLLLITGSWCVAHAVQAAECYGRRTTLRWLVAAQACGAAFVMLKLSEYADKAFMQENTKGTYFPVSGEVVPIFAKDKLTGMAIVCRNISEEEMQKRFFNMAIEESSIYPWQYNTRLKCFHFPDGLLQRFNCYDNTDYISREELDRIVHPEDLSRTCRHFDNIMLGHEPNSRMSFRLQNADGGYEWWEFRSTAYEGLTVDIPYRVLGVCQSIQRYKDTEEELIAARDRALQADRLKSAFLANMSHEIRTPLNAIVGFSDLLKDLQAFSSEEVQQFVETININCTLLLALINDILDLSRIESGTMDFQFSSYNLTFIMQEVYDSQRLSMPQGVELCTDFPEGADKYITTDAVRLKQVLNNLIQP